MQKTENLVRQEITTLLKNFLNSNDYDCDYITSNTLNIPYEKDGEEFEVQIIVKIPKDDLTYENRDNYQKKLEQKKIAEMEKQFVKQEKIRKDKERREQKKKEKESL